MSRDFIGALLQLNAEKGLPREQLVRTVEDAIQSAYRRVAPGYEDVYVKLDTETGEMRIFRARIVVSEVEDETTQWSIVEAQEHDPGAVLGDLVEYEQLEPTHFGRVGAQVAGQVVRQRLREAERETLFDEFAHREGEIITGSVSRVEPSGIILDLGKAEAILRTTDQSASEHYRIGQHVKAYVLEVRRTPRGPLIYVSRTHKAFLRRLFELEVPEIQAGTVEIRAIAREAGSRSKMAVSSRQEGPRPGRCHRRPARRPRAGRRGGAGRREDRHHPLGGRPGRLRRQRPQPGPGRGRQDRRAQPHRRGHGARAHALAGHRTRGPERATGRQADWLAHRHPIGERPRRGGWRAGRHATGRHRAGARPAESDVASAQVAEPEAEQAPRPRPTRSLTAAPDQVADARARPRRDGCGSHGGAAVAGAAVAGTRHVPARTCVACRTRRDKSALLRVVRRPDGRVVFDRDGRIEGRGAYLCTDSTCWTLALRRSALQRALRSALPDDLKIRLEQGDAAPGPVTTGRRAPQMMLGGTDGT